MTYGVGEDVAELYDGFTHITISWIEALGLCGIGEFGLLEKEDPRREDTEGREPERQRRRVVRCERCTAPRLGR